MTTDRDTLARLGLVADEVVLGEAERLDWPSEPVGEAKGLAAAISLGALLLGQGPDTLPAPSGALEKVGVTLRTAAGSPHVVKLASPATDVALVVRLTEDDPEAMARPEGHGDVVAIDTRRSGPFLLAVAGHQVLCVPDPHGLIVRHVVRPLAIAPLTAITAPVLDWLAASRDEWLTGHARQLVEADDSWSRCVAAGLCARLVEPASPADARLRVEAMLRGEVDATLAQPRVWVRSLQAPALDTMEQLALAQVDRLTVWLDRAEAAAEREDEDWVDEWLGLCKAREELEGVAVLLAEAGRAERLRAALDRLDGAARVTRLGLAHADLPRDPLLVRAWDRDADAWWAQAA